MSQIIIGTYLSNEISISSSILIKWSQIIYNNTSITVETNLSIDNGLTYLGWQLAYNNYIVNGTNTEDLTNAKKLQIRITMISEDGLSTPKLSNLKLYEYTWNLATNNELVPTIDTIQDFTNKYLWIKQTLFTNNSAITPQLNSLELFLQNETFNKIVDLLENEETKDKFLWIKLLLSTPNQSYSPILINFLLHLISWNWMQLNFHPLNRFNNAERATFIPDTNYNIWRNETSNNITAVGNILTLKRVGV